MRGAADVLLKDRLGRLRAGCADGPGTEKAL